MSLESGEGAFSTLRMRATQWLGMRLPLPVGIRLAEAYFLQLYRRSVGQRAIVAANLAPVLGYPPGSELVQMATRECFRLYGRYWFETFALRSMPWEEVDRRFVLDGREHIDAAVSEGRGMVIALPHMGNWDAAGHWLAMKGYRLTAVAEELRPPAVFELFLRHRRALGINIVPLSSESKTGQALIGLLARNHVLTLVADRDLTNRGVEATMFGLRRTLPAGPAFLSLVSGAPLHPAAVYTTEEGWRCRIDPPITVERTGSVRADVGRLTGLLAASFERSIASAPTDWHMFQPFWEDTGPGASGPSPPDRGQRVAATLPSS